MPSVLVIDDNAAEVCLLSEAAAQAGCDLAFEAVGDGLQALERLTGPQSRPWPDLALVDLKMPRLDGRGFLARRRDDPRLRILPVFVLSSSALDAEVRDSHALGADGYLVKPPDWGATVDLTRQLSRYLAQGTPIDETLAPEPGLFADRQREAWRRWTSHNLQRSWHLIARSCNAVLGHDPAD